MQKFVVSDPSGPDLEFCGTLVYEGSDPTNGTVSIYRTLGGRYVFRHVCFALRGRPYRNETRIFDSVEQLLEHVDALVGAKMIKEALGRPKRIFIF